MGPILIEGNHLIDGLYWEASIVCVGCNNATIKGNQINASPEGAGMGIYCGGYFVDVDFIQGIAQSKNNTVTQNILRGNFDIALYTRDSTGCNFYQNDLSQVYSYTAQLMLSWGANNNTFSNNAYGPSGLVGLLIGWEVSDDFYPGNMLTWDNTFTNETFPGTQYYPGW